MCDPEHAEGYNSIPSHSVSIDEPATQDSPFSLTQPFPQEHKAGNVQKPAEGCGVFLSRIRARDCKPLDIQEKNPWVVCGKAWSHYVEKLTGERRPRSDKTAGGCAGPATWMRSNGTRQAVILPGSLDVTRMERL